MKVFKKISALILWIFSVILLFGSLGFSIKKTQQLKCSDIRVDITDSTSQQFIQTSDIRQWVLRNYKGVVGRPLESLNLRKIKEGLQKLHAIEEVSVYTNLYQDGIKTCGALVVKIRQRDPVFRVIGTTNSFYMDKLGKVIEWSPRFTPRVLIVGGLVTPEFARKKLLPLITYINNDKFLSAQIDQIYVNALGELSMIPRVGEQLILFGDPEDYELKFRNLKALYSDGFKDGGWSIYKSINLAYNNQIVCTKK